MTRHADLKALVRARMAATGENYTAARAALLAERATDPGSLGVRNAGRAQDPAPCGPHERSSEALSTGLDPSAARAEHERLLRPFLRDGRLVQIPTKRRARFAVLLELLARFAPGDSYTEAEVGDVLRPLHADVAYLRRELVDYGLLTREADGAAYRVTSVMPVREGTMRQEITAWEELWLPRFLAGEIG